MLRKFVRSFARSARNSKRKPIKRRMLRVECLEVRSLLSLAPSLVAISASNASLIHGQMETLTATVSASPGGPTHTPTGTVTFMANGSALGSPVTLNSSAEATLQISTLPVGLDVLTANYSGDSNYAASSTVVGPNSIITTAAGNGTAGYGGDNAQATAAKLQNPAAVAVDSSGHLFIADEQNNRVREVTLATGVITSIAGNGTSGSSGDNGQATAAELNSPEGVAVDNSGHLFISDTDNNRIREVNLSTGVITTVAGNGSYGSSGDNGPATAAEFESPEGIALDSSGNLYVADNANDCVRKVNLTSGAITTVAGNGTGGLSGDGGQATAAEIYWPTSVALDSAGNLNIACDLKTCVRKVNVSTGIISTVAGNGNWGTSGDGSQATAATFYEPSGLAADSVGNLYIDDSNADRVRIVSLSSGVINALAGSAMSGYSGDGGAASAAEFSSPQGLAFDSAGDLFIADEYNSRVREVASGAVAVTVVAAQIPTTTTLAASATTTYYGQTLTLTATVSSTAGVPGGGTVSFVDNGVAIGSAGLAYNTASFTTSTLVAGAQAFTATYNGYGNAFAASTISIVPTSVITTVAGPSGSVASLSGPCGEVLDSAGDLFIADTGDNRVREVNHATGLITTVAGTGVAGFNGDGIQATAAELDAPKDLALDSAGNLYIADSNNNRVRKLNLATGVITTVAGNGGFGSSGDNGQATMATLESPVGLAIDGSGDLFIADSSNRVRKVKLATGIITTFAGGGVADGQPATAAPLSNTQDAVVDAAGDIFIADTGDNRVREVNHATGLISTIAGNGLAGFSGDGGPATAAELSSPTCLALDKLGNLFIVDSENFRVRKLNLASDVISTVAGNGNFWFSGDGGPATSAGMEPAGVALDSSGNIYISDDWGNRVREVNHTTGVITTVAGDGNDGFSGDNGPATAAGLSGPAGLALDAAGNLYIADEWDNRIREVNAATMYITTVAGNGNAFETGDGGPATAATLWLPSGVALDAAGDLFIADSFDACVREVNASSDIISCVAGGGSSLGDGGPATAASISADSVALDSAGNLYIAGGNRVREVNASTQIINTVAGNSNGGSTFCGDGLAATNAGLDSPQHLAVDSAGNLYIADSTNNRIRKVNAATGIISTVAGSSSSGYAGDGTAATAASLQGPAGVAVDALGNIYIADSTNERIREVNASTGIISTLAGSTSGFAGDGGAASTAMLNDPCGLAIDAAGGLYIADDGNNRIREIASGGVWVMVSPAPTSITLAATTVSSTYGQSETLTATVSSSAGTPGGTVTFMAGGAALGSPATLNASGVATLNLTSLPAGTDYLSATYSGAANYAAGTTTAWPGAIIASVAGNGSSGYSGDNGAATAAGLNGPDAVAVDAAGDLFIADTGDNRVREVNKATGVVTTIAGNGTAGYSGDNGQATAAELNHPEGLALDTSGHLFICDTNNNRIREVNLSTGVITTIAGNGTFSYGGDNGPATAADLESPEGIAVDSSGNLYIADNANNRVRKVNLSGGTITTVAGNGTGGYSGDGGLATAAEIYWPTAVALDSAGNLYVACNLETCVRKVNASTGVISTVAGNGNWGTSGDGGPATAATLYDPSGIAVDAAGNLYIDDSTADRVRVVNLATGVINPLAGSESGGYSGDGGPASAAELSDPQQLAVDSYGDLFIVDATNNRVREVAARTSVGVGKAPLTITANNQSKVYGAADPTLTDTITGTFYNGDGPSVISGLTLATTTAATATAGTHPITATGATAANYAITEVNGTLTVSQAALTVTANNQSKVYGAADPTLTYTPSGTLYYSAAYSVITGVTLSTATGATATAGTHPITVSGATAANYAITEVNGVLTVSLAPSAVALSVSSALPVYGQLLTVTATVTSPDGTPNSGTVTFYVNGVAQPNPVAVAGGAAAWTTTALAAGSYAFSAVYSGDPSAYAGNTTAASANSTINTVAGIGVGDGSRSTAAVLLDPSGVARDSAGDLFIADSGDNRVREVNHATGIITTVAGTGAPGYSGNNIQATAAMLDSPDGVALDSAGNLYIADSGNNRIRKVNLSTGVITSVAGNGSGGYGGDNGQATAAELYSPESVAIDTSGDLFIADTGNERIREVNHSTGIITTVAGSGIPFYNGDGIPAIDAYLASPTGVALGTSGDLFIADTGDDRIREVNHSTGIITTVAGTGMPYYNGDGIPASRAALFSPTGVALDAAGDLFIADSGNNRIREVYASSGTIATVAGSATAGFGGDGGAATAAALNGPKDVALDSSGNLYVADAANNRIREVNYTTGVIATVAGGFIGDGGQATSAGLIALNDTAVDVAGDIFIADTADNRIREINHATGLITTVAGTGLAGYNGDGIQATAAMLDAPVGLALDSLGNLYIADSGNQRVREMNLSTGLITTVAGTGTAGFSGDSGPATAAELDRPLDLAVDSSGDLFIADGSNRVREVKPATGIITTIAGGGADDGPPATAAPLSNPQSAVVDSAGNIFIADTNDNRVREVNHATGLIATIAGNGFAGFSGDGGLATAAELSGPTALALDKLGNLFIVDSENFRVRKLNLASDVITTVVGNGDFAFSGDGGPATNAGILPAGVAIDSAGDIYVSDDWLSNRIREVNHATGTITTVAGNGSDGFSGDNGPAIDAGLCSPAGLAVDSAGDLYIADEWDNRIREVNAATRNITTVAGNGNAFESGDGGPATAATLWLPTGVTLDAAGDIFIADYLNGRIREVNAATGIINSIAGGGSSLGDGGPATAGSVSPTTVALDSAGNLYIADSSNNLIRKVNAATKIISAVAGNSNLSSSSCGDGGPATNAALDVPLGITVGPAGNLYIADSLNNRIRVVNAATGVISTFAGNGSAGYAGDGGLATAAEMVNPRGVAVDAAGDLFIADSSNNRVREVNASTGVITTLVGSSAGFSGDGGAASAATVSDPAGLAFDGAGNLYIADTENNRIREVASGGVTVTVGQAPLTITANNQSTVYGAALPTLTASYSGFVNGDTAASLATLPTPTTTATTASAVGSYAITVGGAVDPNYAISYASATLTVTPAPLTITANNQSKAYGASLPSFTASYAGFVNGDTVASLTAAPTFSTTATAASHVSGNPYTIDVSGAADANYSFSYVPGTLSITTAPLAVRVGNSSSFYGGPGPEITVYYAGFVNGDSAANLGGLLGVTTNLPANPPAGSYTATPSGLTSADYSITFASGTLTVYPAPLLISADNHTMQYGAVLPNLTVSYSGFVQGDTAASLTTAPSVSTTASSASAVGSYAITASGAADANYAISYVPGTLTVTPAPLTVTADNQSKVYGATDPALSYTIAGTFYNGDEPAVISGVTLSTTTGAAATAGTHPITASGGTAANYAVTDVSGTLTVSQAPLTVTSNNQSKVYGAADPALTYTPSGTLYYGDPYSVISGVTLSTATGSAATAGTHTITASGGTAANYTISDANGTLTVSPASLTVTANNQSKVYGATDPTLTYTPSGTLYYGDQYSVISGVTLSTTTGAAATVGTYAITASVGASANYSITDANGTLAVTPAPLTVTANNQTKVYGAADPTLTYTPSGKLYYGDQYSVISGVTLATSTAAAATEGTHAITASGGTAANYAITDANGTLTVSPAPLTVTANNQTRGYGAADPAFTASYSGFRFGQTLATSGVSGTPTLSSSDNAGSPSGNYTITAALGTLSAQNYSFSFVNGTLTVLPAPTFALTGPTAGTFTAGNSVTIGWTATSIDAAGPTKITLGYDADATAFDANEHWLEVDGVTAANGAGSYAWNTAGVAAGTYYLCGYTYDFSTGQQLLSHIATSIVVKAGVYGPPAFTLTGPSAGTFTGGRVVTIQWAAASVDVAGPTKISLAYDADATAFDANAHWFEVDQVTAANGAGSYAWNTTGVASGTYYLAGYTYDFTTGQQLLSHLATPFVITGGAPPTFALGGPAAGTFTAGVSVTIGWSATNVDTASPTKISLAYDPDATAFDANAHWFAVDQVTAANGAGSYAWNTTGIASGTYYLSGYMYDFSTSTAVYSHLGTSIVITGGAPPAFTLTGSTVGAFAPGASVTIGWSATNVDVAGPTKITLGYDADATAFDANEHWIEIDGATAANGAGSYVWNTGSVAAGTYYLSGYMYDFSVSKAVYSHLGTSIVIT